MSGELGKVSNVVMAPQERDAELIRKTFKNGDTFLKEVRTLMLGGNLLPDQKSHIKSVFEDASLRDLMRRRFLPSVTDDQNMTLGVVRDVWVGAEGMIFGASRETIEQAAKYKALAIEFTKIGLGLLENPDGEKVPMKVLPFEQDPLQIELLGRNMYIRHIDEQLAGLWLIANQEQKETTPKTTKKEGREARLRNG